MGLAVVQISFAIDHKYSRKTQSPSICGTRFVFLARAAIKCYDEINAESGRNRKPNVPQPLSLAWHKNPIESKRLAQDGNRISLHER